MRDHKAFIAPIILIGFILILTNVIDFNELFGLSKEQPKAQSPVAPKEESKHDKDTMPTDNKKDHKEGGDEQGIRHTQTEMSNKIAKEEHRASLDIAKTFTTAYFSYDPKKPLPSQEIKRLATDSFYESFAVDHMKQYLLGRKNLSKRIVKIDNEHAIASGIDDNKMTWHMFVTMRDTVVTTQPGDDKEKAKKELKSKVQDYVTHNLVVVYLKQEDDKWLVGGVEVSYGE